MKDYRFQAVRDKMIWTTKDLWIFFMYGSIFGLLVGFLLGLSI